MTSNQNLSPNNAQLDAAKMIKREKIFKIIKYVLLYAFLIFMAIFIVIPFYWMFATALRSEAELQATQISFFPKEWLFSNFKEAIMYAARKEVNFFFPLLSVKDTQGEEGSSSGNNVR